MVPMHVLNALAAKETSKSALLRQLRETGATSVQTATSLERPNDQTDAAIADLLSSGAVREARPGQYYLDEAKVPESKSPNAFTVLLLFLLVLSFIASLVSLAVRAG